MISWNDIWKEKATASGLVRDTKEQFDEDAPIWEWWSIPGWWEDGQKRIDSIETNSSWTALEIGPGPGIVTIPLAKKVRSITVIEPSRSMITALERKAREEQLVNIQILRSTWEKVRPDEVRGHDIVIASDSLFFIDLRDAIRKMNLLARRKVHLFWMSEMPTWERIRAELWPQIFGTEYVAFPKADVVFNVLHEMGVHPELRIIDTGSGCEPRFNSNEQAIEYIKYCIGGRDRRHDETISKFVNERLKKDGSLQVKESNEYAWISWSPRTMLHEENIDWDEAWRQRLFNSGFLHNPPYFESEIEAIRYNDCPVWWAMGETNVKDLDLDPSWSAIDVGSGPGTLTIPLAKRLREVTAVEPSGGMLPFLQRNVRDNGLSNVRIMHSRWEDIQEDDIGIHDVVVASFCLLMPNIREALAKMNRLAREQVHIFWFSGPPIWERIGIDIGREVGSPTPPPMPKADILYGLLCSMGYHPEVRNIRSFSSPYTFRDISEAKRFVREYCGVNVEGEPLLIDYLQRNLEMEADALLLKDDPGNYVRIMWKPLRGGDCAR